MKLILVFVAALVALTGRATPVGTSYASYYGSGWQGSRTLPNGIVSSFDYNPVGALTSLSNTLSSSTLSAFSSFMYDGVFNMTGFSANYGSGSSLPNGARTFDYDSKDRLSSFALPTSGTLTEHSAYSLDSAGNRIPDVIPFLNYNADNQPELSGYEFDGNGNPTTYDETSLSFDPENRMTAYGSASSASYRADGLRASKTTSSGTTYFLYDGSEPIVEMNSSGTVTALNIFAPDGLVARQTSSATSEYVFDQQGNVADTTNASGAIQTITQYDAWGNEQAISGTPADPFGYNAQSGYYFDRETGLYLCQHRFYDPSNGRWLNRDPIGYAGGTNLYGYCAEGPVNWADQRGTDVAPLPPPPFPVPYGDPGTGWKWVPNPNAGYGQRPGKWVPDGPVSMPPGSKGGKPSTSWDPETDEHRGHYDTDDGMGNRTRQDENGNPLTDAEAHSPPCPPTPHQAPFSTFDADPTGVPGGYPRIPVTPLPAPGGFPVGPTGFPDPFIFPDPVFLPI